MIMVANCHTSTTLKKFLHTQHVSLFSMANSSSGDSHWIIYVAHPWNLLFSCFNKYNHTFAYTIFSTQCLKYPYKSHGIARVSLTVGIKNCNGFMFFNMIRVWWIAHIDEFGLDVSCHFVAPQEWNLKNFKPQDGVVTQNCLHRLVSMTLTVPQVMFEF